MHSTPREDRLGRLAAEPGIELPVFDGPLCAFQLGDPSAAGSPIHLGGDLHATHPEGRDRLSEEGIDRSLDAAVITITDQVHEKILVTAREGIWCLPSPPELHDSTPYLMIWDTDGGLRTWLLLPPARLMIGSAHLWLPSVPPPPGARGRPRRADRSVAGLLRPMTTPARDRPFGLPAAPAQPLALARLPVGRHGLPREFVERNQRSRLITAALDVFTAHGYTEASVAQVIAAAGVSRKTFYAHFADKEACLLAAHDLLVDWLAEEARRSAADAEGWPRRVIAVVVSLSAHLSADARLARLLTVEILRAGAPARARHEKLVGRLADGLAAGRDVAPDGPAASAVLEPVLVAGVLGFVGRLQDGGMGEGLPHLASEISEVLLAPYVGGPVAAHRIAVG